MNKLVINIFTAVAFSFPYSLFAQAITVSTTIEKENRNAVMIEISQPVAITVNALDQKLRRSGLHEKVKNGVATYKGVILSEISGAKIDIYTKVEEGPNNTSVAYMAVSKGYNNFTNSTTDSTITANVELFMNSLVLDAKHYSADMDIGVQQKDEDKSQKEYQQLLDEQQNLEKQKVQIDNRLIEIQNKLNTKKVDLDIKKAGVDDSKAKRNPPITP